MEEELWQELALECIRDILEKKEKVPVPLPPWAGPAQPSAALRTLGVWHLSSLRSLLS